MTEFIFFLTYNDQTVKEALNVFKQVKNTGVKNIGFKDVGLPMDELIQLKNSIDETGLTSYLEVVSGDKDSTLNSVRNAIELEVDHLIGGYGEYAEEVFKVVQGTDINFYPYVGKISGIPCVLEGSIREIVREAKKKEDLGVGGIDLLAYRYEGDSERLMNEVIEAIDIPVIVAGSINSEKRIRQVMEAGAAGFTIGTAIFDKEFASSRALRDQLHKVLHIIGS